MNNMNNWLNKLKVGDVVVRHGNKWNENGTVRITKLTARFVVADSSYFSKEDGRKRGSPEVRILELTAEWREIFQKAKEARAMIRWYESVRATQNQQSVELLSEAYRILKDTLLAPKPDVCVDSK